MSRRLIQKKNKNTKSSFGHEVLIYYRAPATPGVLYYLGNREPLFKS
jgi:hypothetical protein